MGGQRLRAHWLAEPSKRWLVVFLLLLAWALRVGWLGELPAGWRDDELIEIDMDSRIAAGWRPLYIEEAEGHEPLYHYAHAATIRFFGAQRWSYRLLSAICGLLTVALTLAIGRRWFGLRAGLLAAAAMAVGFWPLMYSRIGLRQIGVLPPLLLVFLSLRLRAPPYGTVRAGLVRYTVCGVALAAGLYLYFAGRVVPLVLAGVALYLLLFHRATFRANWRGLLWAGALAALLFAPLGLYLAGRPLETRLVVVGSPLLELRAGRPELAFRTALGTLGMFTFGGDPEWLYNMPGRPAFDWISGAFLYLGLGMALWRWRRAENGVLILWLVGGLAPAMVSLPAASFGHAIAALPAAYLALGVGLDVAARWLAQRGNFWRALGVVIGVVVLGLHGVLSVHDYAATWNRQRATRFLYHADQADLARYLNRNPEIGDVAVATTNEELLLDARGIQLDLNRSPAVVRLFDPRHALVLPAGDAARVGLVSDPLPAAHVEQELSRHADWVGDGPDTVNGPAFRLYGVRPPALPPAPQATFEGQLSLVEVEFERDPALPTPQALRVRTAWRVEPGAVLPAGLRLFVHLLAPDGSLLVAGDRTDVWLPALQPGDRFVQWNSLPLPAGTEAGQYQVAVGWYEVDGERWRIDGTGEDAVSTGLTLR